MSFGISHFEKLNYTGENTVGLLNFARSILSVFTQRSCYVYGVLFDLLTFLIISKCLIKHKKMSTVFTEFGVMTEVISLRKTSQ